jgi:hypothetical protein
MREKPPGAGPGRHAAGTVCGPAPAGSGNGARGGHALAGPSEGLPETIPAATGGKVHTASGARRVPGRRGCREAARPPGTPVRLSGETGDVPGGYRLPGEPGTPVSVRRLGAPVPLEARYEGGGPAPGRVAAAIRTGLAPLARRNRS